MNGDDRLHTSLRSGEEHVIQNIMKTQTRRVIPDSSLQKSIGLATAEKQSQREVIAQSTQAYLAQQYQNQLALNEQQQAIMRKIGQQIEFLACQFQALKEVAETMGVQQNKISFLEERSRAASEARWDFSSIRLSSL